MAFYWQQEATFKYRVSQMSSELQKEFNSYLYIGEVLQSRGMLPELEAMLCHRGGRIHHVTRNAEARAFVENYRVSAILIDQYLPQCSGLELMRWLQGFARIPVIIIILSKALTDTETVIALEAGAADAVPEDVNPRELAARVRASIRKVFHGAPEVQPESRDTLQVYAKGNRQPLYFNVESRRVYFSDASRVVLNVKEAELLVLLGSKHPQYIDREEISQHLFQQSWNPSDRRIDNLVSRLRRVLDAWDGEGAEPIIETVRHEGYRLRLPIALIQVEQAPLLAFPDIDAQQLPQ
jgi:DNA-binding response OmpR family regulator